MRLLDQGDLVGHGADRLSAEQAVRDLVLEYADVLDRPQLAQRALVALGDAVALAAQGGAIPSGALPRLMKNVVLDERQNQIAAAAALVGGIKLELGSDTRRNAPVLFRADAVAKVAEIIADELGVFTLKEMGDVLERALPYWATVIDIGPIEGDVEEEPSEHEVPTRDRRELVLHLSRVFRFDEIAQLVVSCLEEVDSRIAQTALLKLEDEVQGSKVWTREREIAVFDSLGIGRWTRQFFFLRELDFAGIVEGAKHAVFRGATQDDTLPDWKPEADEVLREAIHSLLSAQNRALLAKFNQWARDRGHLGADDDEEDADGV